MVIMLLLRFHAVPCFLSTTLLCATAFAQTGPGCHPTLGYLADTIPATGDIQLDKLRQRILTTRIADVVSKASNKRLSVEQSINLANQEADGTDANLPKLEAVLEAEASADQSAAILRALAARDYSSADLTSSRLGVASRDYIINDWHNIAYRETANQLFCFTLARPGDPDGPLLYKNPPASGPQIIEDSEAPDDAPSEGPPATEYGAAVPDTVPEDLESTLEFLQSRLNALGPITWIETTQTRGRKASEITEKNTVEFQSVEAEPERCALSFHERHLTTPNVEKPSELDETVTFTQPREITLFTLSNRAREDYQASRTRQFRSLTPEITVLHIADGTRHGASFYFTDVDEARRVAAAATHAANLCSQRAETTYQP